MAKTYIINDRIADPEYVKTVTPFTNTNVLSQAKVYFTQSGAESDCAILNSTYPPPSGGQQRFWVGAHP